MTESLTAQQAEIVRLNKIVKALMDRVERSNSATGSDFGLFQSTVMLEERIRLRTLELQAVLRENDRINAALSESEAKYRALVDQSLVGIATVENGRLTYVNPRFAEIAGCSESEILGMTPHDFVIQEDHALLDEQMRRRLSGEIARSHYLLRCRRKNGDVIDVEVYGGVSEFFGRRVLTAVIQDITERIRAEREIQLLQEKLREQSILDPLTGMYNRRYLEESLGRELILAERLGHPISLIMVDLDHFKNVNDDYGHQAGDRVLQSIAGLLKHSARGSDIFCRYGGEEFLLVLPRMDGAEAAEKAEHLRRVIASTPVDFAGLPIDMTASFGLAVYPVDGVSGQAVIAAADAALYAAKSAGRNCVKGCNL